MQSNYWTNYWAGRRATRRRFIGGASAVGAGAAGFALVGCGDDDDDDANEGPTPDEPTPGNGDDPTAEPTTGDEEFDASATLRAAIASDVGSLDPQSVAGTGGGNWPNYTVHFVVPLAKDPETSDIVGYLADWEWAEASDALILTVREGIEFPNGEALDAEQIAFNVERSLGTADYNQTMQAGHSSTLASVDRTEVVDERTVRLVIGAPDVSLPFKLSQAYNMPLVPMQYVKENGDDHFARNPVGLGPFEFVSHSADTEIVSRRNESFFQGRDAQIGPRLPYVQDLIQRVIPESQSRMAALEAGEVDIVSNVPADLARDWESKSGFQVFYLPGDQPMHIHFNTMVETDAMGNPGDNPWRDKRVRMAANLAVDLDAIIDNLLTGQERYSFGTTQQAFGFPEDLKDNAWGFDPEQARALLAEAGYEDGFDTRFTGPTERWPNTNVVMQAIAGYLEEVGIRSHIELSQYGTWITEVQSHEQPGMWFMGLATGADPASNFLFGYRSDGAYASSYDPETDLDSLIDQSLETFDVAERNALNAEIIRTHYENAQWLYLYEPVGVAAGTDKLAWNFYEKVLAEPEYWNIKVRA